MTHQIVAAPEEYERLRTDAGVADRSARTRLTFSGDKAGETLSGLVTSDVLALQPGHGQFAAALTPKGKVLADVRIFRRMSGDYLIDVSAAASDGFLGMVRKYVNPRFAKCADVSTALSCITVVGPHARPVMAHALACSPSVLDLLPAFANTDLPFATTAATVARSVDFGIDSFDCFVPSSAAAALREALETSGAAGVSLDALETLRIEAGRPAWGVDMTDDTLLHEAILDTLDAVSYTKGCYTGQEVVARLHFRGHVNRLLRGLRLASPATVGATVLASDAEVGDVRSCAVSPRLGAIALAMVRREVEPGTSVTVRHETGTITATLLALPFPA